MTRTPHDCRDRLGDGIRHGADAALMALRAARSTHRPSTVPGACRPGHARTAAAGVHASLLSSCAASPTLPALDRALRSVCDGTAS